MILQILADTLQRVCNRDPSCLKSCGRTDAGALKQNWRTNRARGHNHFCPGKHLKVIAVLFVSDTDSTVALEQHLGRQRTADHSQILPGKRRLEIGVAGRRTTSAIDRHMHLTKSFLLVTVVVLSSRIPCLNACIDKCPI